MEEQAAADISNDPLHISAHMHTGYDTHFTGSLTETAQTRGRRL